MIGGAYERDSLLATMTAISNGHVVAVCNCRLNVVFIVNI